MRWSQAFIPTLREDPADAEVPSHRLMLRAGLVRQLASGIYTYLPLGQRVLQRVAAIIREEMLSIGAQEFLLPALHPAELWRESGRWEEMGEEMFRLRDRKQAELCLGMTHEEIFTAIAGDLVKSYRDLPQIWYQIQLKFRDEPRPKSGVLRGRQFTMKDSYSFALDLEGLDAAYESHAEAYRRICRRCGLPALEVEAWSGTMGGEESHEFVVLSDAGEDKVVTCSACGYAANLEMASSRPSSCAARQDLAALERFATPRIKTIEELAALPGGAPPSDQIKTLAYRAAGQLMLCCVRGDHVLSETKLATALGTPDVRPAQPDEIEEALGALPGSLGAVGVSELSVWVDEALRGRSGMTTGANRDGYHLRHVDPERDFLAPRYADLRTVADGEGCPSCGKPLELRKAIEVGHIFKLGVRYSEALGARVLGPDGVETPVVMGSYGIGLDRIVAAAIEVHHDRDGIRWPAEIAPYDVVITPVGPASEGMRAAQSIYLDLARAGFEVLLDDRDERPGVKFKDADLIGIPFRVVPGARALAKGRVEVFRRSSGETCEVPPAELPQWLRENPA